MKEITFKTLQMVDFSYSGETKYRFEFHLRLNGKYDFRVLLQFKDFITDIVMLENVFKIFVFGHGGIEDNIKLSEECFRFKIMTKEEEIKELLKLKSLKMILENINVLAALKRSGREISF